MGRAGPPLPWGHVVTVKRTDSRKNTATGRKPTCKEPEEAKGSIPGGTAPPPTELGACTRWTTDARWPFASALPPGMDCGAALLRRGPAPFLLGHEHPVVSGDGPRARSKLTLFSSEADGAPALCSGVGSLPQRHVCTQESRGVSPVATPSLSEWPGHLCLKKARRLNGRVDWTIVKVWHKPPLPGAGWYWGRIWWCLSFIIKAVGRQAGIQPRGCVGNYTNEDRDGQRLRRLQEEGGPTTRRPPASLSQLSRGVAVPASTLLQTVSHPLFSRQRVGFREKLLWAARDAAWAACDPADRLWGGQGGEWSARKETPTDNKAMSHLTKN